MALVVAAAVLAGCSRGPRAPWRAATLRAGYAYTAVLMTRHPLYAALVDLETALADLGDGQWSPVLPPLDTRFAPLMASHRLVAGDPAGQIAARREDWRESYPPLELPRDALTQDLQARIAWEQRQAGSDVTERLAQAEAEETRRIAQLRAALVLQYQERLTNLRIDEVFSRSQGDEAAAERARAERERVWQAIEAELEAERGAGRELLAELEERLRAEAEGRLATVRQRADAVAAERSATMAAAGAELHDEMAAALARAWPQPAPEAVELTAQSAAANQRLATAEGARQAAEAARREVAERQRREVLRALGRLRAQLKSETETAARVVAHRDGIDLRLLPGRAPHGADVTSSMARKLEAFWSEAGRRRS